jgi:hypothetical protein
MAASTGATGRGATLKIGDGGSPTENFVAVANIASISLSGRNADEVDFTHLGSDGGYREFRQGFKDAGELQITVHFDPASATHLGGTRSIEALLTSGDVFNWEIHWPAKNKKAYGAGYFRSNDISFNVDDPVGGDASIRVTGQVLWTNIT